MKEITAKNVDSMTGDYQEWLISHLKNKKAACAHLQVALEEYQQDGDKASFLLSLRHVAMAQGGIAHLAKETHLNRESLYRLLSGKGNPTLETLMSILRVFGLKMKLAAS
jgi:probable addiction module antidote protein